MTNQLDIINDPNYISVLDHGFAGRVDSMGDDTAIVRAARVSYGEGTKKVSEDRALIRYLVRHAHTSPLEMVVLKFHLKMPIFVARQLVRHRTASLNEYSGRYSIMSNEFYLPAQEHIKPQSVDNKQGRDGGIDDLSKHGVAWLMQAAYGNAYSAYDVLCGDRANAEDYFDPYDSHEPLLSDEFPGIARELARSVLPVGNYTEMYWQINLSNLFKFLKLRRDRHAQFEIRVLADAIYQLTQPIVPLACEAYEDYIQDAVTLSRMEIELLRRFINFAEMEQALNEGGGRPDMTKRELMDFKNHFRIAA